MSTFTITGLTGAEIQRLGHLIQTHAAADHGARRTRITISDAPYTLTLPDGSTQFIAQGSSTLTVSPTWAGDPSQHLGGTKRI